MSEAALDTCWEGSRCQPSFSRRKTIRSSPTGSSRFPPSPPTPDLRVVVTAHGGHCGFIQRWHPREDMFWAENRLVDFITATEARRDTFTAPNQR